MKIIAKFSESAVHHGVPSYLFILVLSPRLPSGEQSYGISIADIGQTETEILAQMQALAVETGNAKRVSAGLPGDLNITDIRGGTL